jgi:thiamine-phosphate diphosphorylase
MPATQRERRIHGLYVIVDPAACGGRSAVDVARMALEGGARMLQWRDKLRDKGDQLDDVRRVREMCDAHDALLIVNDHADLALAAGAAGVHVGQHDLPVAAVRLITGASAIIGVSTNNPDEARRGESDGADYVAVGAIFPTQSKGVTRPADLQRLRDVKAAVSLPVVAIGGIGPANIGEVIAAGADAAAVISAVCGAPDPRAAAAALSAAFVDAKPPR